MKPFLSALLLAACAPLALAQQPPTFTDVPPSLQKALQGHGLRSAQLDGGTLRLVSGKPQVSELAFASFVFHGICAHQWRQPAEFARWQLARVQLLDASGQQGYAFDARGDVCQRLGERAQNYHALIQRHTQACAAGACPAQP
ncbi:hypothetical protein SAMN05428957_106181 [Oryzisolibacter propanilivorax]|uniref:Lipoprotein n=1 Tax=Oryzisolibacter propanilivorax TaxID=1527607 RepID=A0A1G9TKT3_9BURK|nr:hypothetical protein [Oryzisolibacter propanilivorax]SDM48044.1 hypothetical protein SAMN05428957_106181 [Oryzisolibacter propanilivorax]